MSFLTLESLLGGLGAATSIVEVVTTTQDGGATHDLPESAGRHDCWLCMCAGCEGEGVGGMS